MYEPNPQEEAEHDEYRAAMAAWLEAKQAPVYANGATPKVGDHIMSANSLRLNINRVTGVLPNGKILINASVARRRPNGYLPLSAQVIKETVDTLQIMMDEQDQAEQILMTSFAQNDAHRKSLAARYETMLNKKRTIFERLQRARQALENVSTKAVQS